MKSRRRKKRAAGTFEVIDAPDRLAIRVHAANWRELLRAAAAGMFSLSSPELRAPVGAATRMLPVELEAPDYATLVVEWLNELLALSRNESMIFTATEVLQLDLETTCRLAALVEGEHAQTLPQRIKGVASCVVEIEESERGLATTIVLET